jgi:very-short-patch-repair endonuclease
MCPYCVNQKLCEVNECNVCFEKSFASQEKVKYWNTTNNTNPRTLFKSSAKKFNFICNICNLNYNAALSNVSAGYWCNCVKNKTEYKLYNELLQIYNNLIKQYKVDWCKNITHLPFDYCIEESKIIIELDGPQHFRQVSNWSSPEKQFKNDKYKEKCANENGYSVIRLLQEDVLYDRYNWLNELNQTIEKIIQNIYMCKNNEYNVFEI